MIITCPQCDARFVVPSTIFMKGGRKMKCANCANVWFQDEPLEKLDSADDEFVRHVEEDNVATPAKTKKAKKNKRPFFDTLKTDFMIGKWVVLIGFTLGVLGVALYAMMSKSIIMGHGLSFDNIAIEREGDSIMILGDIVNNMNDPRGVPSIVITEILNDDIHGNVVIKTIDHDVLDGGESVPFEFTLNAVDIHIQNLNVTFNDTSSHH